MSEQSMHNRGYRFELQQEGMRWRYSPAAGAESPSLTAPGLVPALERAIAAIDYLNRTPTHRATSAAISSELGITKSHCHNILKTLVHFRWLKFDERTKTYELSSGILAYASSLLGSPVLQRIRTELTQLVRRIQIPAVLVQPQPDDSFIVVDKFNGPKSMEISVPIGQHMPRDATATMRGYLAWQPYDRIEQWLEKWQPIQHTERSLMTQDQVIEEIAATRRRGYARSQEEFSEGIMALSMPIFDQYGEVSYVFTCSGLASQIAPKEARIAEEIVAAAIEINRLTLGRVPADFPSGRL
jgi:DNA-binding IclR family transcriptional regulator